MEAPERQRSSGGWSFDERHPKIGYDKAAEIAKEAFATGRTVRELAVQKEVLPLDELEKVLDARSQTEGG